MPDPPVALTSVDHEAVVTPDVVPDMVIADPPAVKETLNAPVVLPTTKYIVPAVMPVGNAPVVEKITASPLLGGLGTYTFCVVAVIVVDATIWLALTI